VATIAWWLGEFNVFTLDNINEDEFQHLPRPHTAAQRSLIPYRDFFEHHTSIDPFLLSPILGFPIPLGVSSNAFEPCIGLGRYMMWVSRRCALVLDRNSWAPAGRLAVGSDCTS